jgi:hypothetical protein
VYPVPASSPLYIILAPDKTKSVMANALPLIVALVAAAGCAALASATSYTVGDSQGWTTTGVDYSSWASRNTFVVGDTLGEL